MESQFAKQGKCTLVERIISLKNLNMERKSSSNHKNMSKKPNWEQNFFTVVNIE